MTQGHVIIDGETITVKFVDQSDYDEAALLIAQLDTLIAIMDNETQHGHHQRSVFPDQAPAR